MRRSNSPPVPDQQRLNPLFSRCVIGYTSNPFHLMYNIAALPCNWMYCTTNSLPRIDLRSDRQGAFPVQTVSRHSTQRLTFKFASYGHDMNECVTEGILLIVEYLFVLQLQFVPSASSDSSNSQDPSDLVLEILSRSIWAILSCPLDKASWSALP